MTVTLIFHISNKERAKLSIDDAFLWTIEFKEHMQEDLVTASASQSLEKVPLVLPVVHALKSHTKYAGHCSGLLHDPTPGHPSLWGILTANSFLGQHEGSCMTPHQGITVYEVFSQQIPF